MNIPRFNKAPIDTSVFNRMMLGTKDTKVTFHLMVAKVINDIWGTNPLSNKVYQGADEVISRQLFAVMMRIYSKETLAKIGNYIGKDHSTIHTSQKAVKDMYDTNKTFREKYNKIEKKVKELKH